MYGLQQFSRPCGLTKQVWKSQNFKHFSFKTRSEAVKADYILPEDCARVDQSGSVCLETVSITSDELVMSLSLVLLIFHLWVFCSYCTKISSVSQLCWYNIWVITRWPKRGSFSVLFLKIGFLYDKNLRIIFIVSKCFVQLDTFEVFNLTLFNFTFSMTSKTKVDWKKKRFFNLTQKQE